MLTASYKKHTLYFRNPAGTSRGILQSKTSYFILISASGQPGITGVGECSIIPGLSPDDRPGLEEKLRDVCTDIENISKIRKDYLSSWPAINAAVEMAIQDLETGGKRILFASTFTGGVRTIPIHGLIWMGKPESMLHQIDEKLNSGFRVIKMKIGALPFDEEISVIRYIRKHFKEADIEIRLDANGAFSPAEANVKLERLSEFNIHSIEQPFRPGQPETMAELCLSSPIPVALDEELTGISGVENINRLLDLIRPQYLVIKPSLLGGFESAESWIQAASKRGIGWWANSALESNIGLNALAQWVAASDNPIVQGLGTGSLYTNNIPSPLTGINGELRYDPVHPWDLSAIQ